MPVGGVQVPSTLSSATTIGDPMTEGHVFDSGIHEPAHSGILSFMYPQYYLTALLERVGATEMESQSIVSWNEMDRTRDSIEVSSFSAEGNPTITATLGTSNYFVVGDLVVNERGVLGRVGSVPAANQVVITKYPSGNWSVGAAGTDFDTDDTNYLFHVGTAFEQGSSAPKGRVFLPTEKYNYMTISRRTASVTGSELTNKTYLGQSGASPWFWKNEELTLKEFRRDIEGNVLFGERSTDVNSEGVYVLRGILDYIINDGGVTNTYASGTGIAESDLQNMIVDILVRGGSDEITVLAGSQAFADIQVALKDYAVNGSMSYGSFGDNTVGLNFTAYKFFDKTLNLVHYELFNDETMVHTNQNSIIADAIKDYRDFSLWLDLGLAAVGEPNLKLVYKELDGRSRKFIRKMKWGVTDDQGPVNVASGDDRLDIFFLSEYTIKLRNSHRQGILYANS